MPSKTKSLLDDANEQVERLTGYMTDCHHAINLLGHLDLDENTTINPYGEQIWINTSHREDLEKLLTLAPVGKLWTKTSYESQIVYSVDLPDNKSLHIHASNGALPPTCHVEEIDEIIPAQPETTRKKKVIRCAPVKTEESSGTGPIDETPRSQSSE